MRKFAVLVAMLAIFLWACSQKDREPRVGEGGVKGAVYESEALGWTISIPDGWTVMSRDMLMERMKKGIGHISETIDEDVDNSAMEFVISFQKDNSNSFQSTAALFEGTYSEWTEDTKAVRGVIFDTYLRWGMQADTSSSSVIIDGLPFDLFRIQISNTLGEVVRYQDIYNGFINNYSLGVILNYNNDNDRDAMENVFLNSEFNSK